MNQNNLKNIIDKYLSGNANEQEREFIDAWYQKQEIEGEQPNNVNDGLRIKLFEKISQETFSRTITSKKNNILFLRLSKIAASLFLVGAMAFYFYIKHAKKAEYSFVSTQRGGIKKVVLADSSVVWLNISTEIKYGNKFNQKKREVWLNGEAYFEIKHNQTKPFIIHTNNLTTSVLGTAFNINSYNINKEVVVTVTRGKVGLTALDNSSSTFLTANQKGVYTVGVQTIEKSRADAANAIAWINGGFDFKEMKFSEIAERLERRFGVGISFSTEKLKRCPLTASFRKDASLEEILTILSEIENCRFAKDKKNNKYLISGEGCN
nr:FecR family protein [uncultured Pedobacter sp.]